MELKEKLIAAKMKLQLKYKFLLYAIYENSFNIKEEQWILEQTGNATNVAFVTYEHDKFVVYFSDKFIEKEKVDSIAGIILHEIMHAVLGHLDRMFMPEIIPNIYNIAADFYINGKILKENKVKLPKNALYNKNFDNFGSTDEIYEYLLKKSKNSNIEYPVLEGFDKNNISNSKNKETLEKLKSQIQAGLSIESAIGDSKGDSIIKSLFTKAVTPVIDWRLIVSQCVNTVKGHDDYSYFVRNPLSTDDFILPGTYDNTLNLCFIVDVSGSIMERGLTNILMEIIAATTFAKISGKIITCDTSAEIACEFNHDDNLQNKFQGIRVSGGGGTDMNIGLVFAKELNEDFDLYVLVTDGYIDKTDATILNKKLLVLSTDIDCSNSIKGDFEFAKINHI